MVYYVLLCIQASVPEEDNIMQHKQTSSDSASRIIIYGSLDQ